MKKVLFILVLAVLLVLLMCSVAFAADSEPGVTNSVDWTEIIIAVVGLLFSAFVIPLLQVAFSWLRNRTKNESLLATLNEAETVAMNVVSGLQANIVNGMKDAAADGKLTKDDICVLGERAYTAFVQDLSAESYAVISANADNVAAWVQNLIEKKLIQLKATNQIMLGEICETEDVA